MAFNLSIQAAAVLEQGGKLQIDDVSVWEDATYPTRSSYGLLILSEYRIEETPTVVDMEAYDPLVDSMWLANTPENGRYSFALYAFVKIGVEAPATGDVQMDPADGLLYQWDGAAFARVDLANVLAKAAYTSTVLEVPFLAYAYHFKNLINLQYVKNVKRDTDRGMEQNKLYYSRTALDYFTALILASEYNWSIELYNNFYQIVIELNAIINSGNVE